MYGSSAGAINATYFLSGQRNGVNIYREDIANDRFVNLRRLVPRRGEQPQSAYSVFLFSFVVTLTGPGAGCAHSS